MNGTMPPEHGRGDFRSPVHNDLEHSEVPSFPIIYKDAVRLHGSTFPPPPNRSLRTKCAYSLAAFSTTNFPF